MDDLVLPTPLLPLIEPQFCRHHFPSLHPLFHLVGSFAAISSKAIIQSSSSHHYGALDTWRAVKSFYLLQAGLVGPSILPCLYPHILENIHWGKYPEKTLHATSALPRDPTIRLKRRSHGLAMAQI
jgi:hypothetical protein